MTDRERDQRAREVDAIFKLHRYCAQIITPFLLALILWRVW